MAYICTDRITKTEYYNSAAPEASLQGCYSTCKASFQNVYKLCLVQF